MVRLPGSIFEVVVVLGEAALLPLDVEVVELHPGQADGEVHVGQVPGHRDGEVRLLRGGGGGRRVRIDLASLSDN